MTIKEQIDRAARVYQEKKTKETMDQLQILCYRPFLGYLRTILFDKDIALDVLHVYFEKEIYKTVSAFMAGKKPFFSYAITVLKWRAITQIQNIERDKGRAGQDARQADSIVEEDHSYQITRHSIRAWLAEALESVKNKAHKKALLFRLSVPAEGDSLKVAHALGITIGAYYSRFHRAKQAIRDQKTGVPFDPVDINRFSKDRLFHNLLDVHIDKDLRSKIEAVITGQV